MFPQTPSWLKGREGRKGEEGQGMRRRDGEGMERRERRELTGGEGRKGEREREGRRGNGRAGERRSPTSFTLQFNHCLPDFNPPTKSNNDLLVVIERSYIDSNVYLPTPYKTQSISEHSATRGSFAKIGSGTSNK